jgi:CheY-like chemotaxis protein
MSRKYGGTGLGLTIARQLAVLMGGSIEVTSELGKGSNFTLRLPLSLAEDAVPEEQAANSKPSKSGRISCASPRILLVEDHKPNVMVATMVLESFGYECDVASNGFEAIEKATGGNYDVVLMDVQMPGLNGFEATHRIRTHEKENNKHRMHIIGMTAHALLGDKERCLEAEMDDYISKPFDAENLRDKIEAALSKRLAA